MNLYMVNYTNAEGTVLQAVILADNGNAAAVRAMQTRQVKQLGRVELLRENVPDKAERPSRWRVSWDDYDGSRRETVFGNSLDAAAEAILLVAEDYDNVRLEEIPGGEPQCSKTS